MVCDVEWDRRELGRGKVWDGMRWDGMWDEMRIGMGCGGCGMDVT